MSFIWSSLLYLLILVPVLIWLYIRSQRQRSAIASRYGSLGVVQAPGKNVGRWRHIPALMFLLGITVLITSAARPQATVMVPKLEGTVILTFDVSGSMAADDLQPSRMEAAKTAAREFVERQPSNVVIGVVAFSQLGAASVVFYLAAYIATNLLAFGVVMAFSRVTGLEDITDYAGMSRRNPWLGLMMLAAFLSLAGMPPFGGFVAKVFVFAAGVQAGYTWLIIVGILNSILGVYYYLNTMKFVYLYRMPNEEGPAST